MQTQIRIGRPEIRRNDPDYIPLYVSNRIFGGSYNSRLNTEVRIKKGLTYGANTVWDVRRKERQHPGLNFYSHRSHRGCHKARCRSNERHGQRQPETRRA